jgi:hypothetical protein
MVRVVDIYKHHSLPWGATTFSIMTLSITIKNTMLYIMTFSVMILDTAKPRAV